MNKLNIVVENLLCKKCEECDADVLYCIKRNECIYENNKEKENNKCKK